MFEFEFEAELLTLKLNTPALSPLDQLLLTLGKLPVFRLVLSWSNGVKIEHRFGSTRFTLKIRICSSKYVTVDFFTLWFRQMEFLLCFRYFLRLKFLLQLQLDFLLHLIHLWQLNFLTLSLFYYFLSPCHNPFE